LILTGAGERRERRKKKGKGKAELRRGIRRGKEDREQVTFIAKLKKPVFTRDEDERKKNISCKLL